MIHRPPSRPPVSPPAHAALLLGALMGMAIAPPAASDNPADLDTHIDKQITQLQAAKQRADEAEQQIRQAHNTAVEAAIEAAINAELNRLSPTTAQGDQASNGSNATNASPHAAPPPHFSAHAAPPESPAAWLPWPPRVINPLGMVRSQTTDLGPAGPGADNLAIQLPAPAATPDAHAPLHVRIEPGRLIFEHPAPHRDNITLAHLYITHGRLIWVWQSFSPLPLGTALNDLDQRLRRSLINVRAGHTLLRQTQFQPPRHVLALAPPGQGPTTLDCLPGHTSARLTPGPPAAGWVLQTPNDHTLTWVSRDQILTATLHAVPAELSRLAHDTAAPPHLSITARRAPGIAPQIAELSRQITQWKNDLQPPVASGVDIPRAQKHLARLEQQRDQLRAFETQISTHPPALGTPPSRISDLSFTVTGGPPQAALIQLGFE